MKISGAPINYKAAGAWQPIDDTLQPGADGSAHPAASPTPVSFPASLGSGPVTIGPSDRQLSFSLQGASASGTSAGTEQSYSGALPGVDVSYATSPESVRETLTLASASAPTTYRYALSLSDGMKASLSPGGGVAVRDASGKLLYSVATPSVDDSSGKAHLPWTAPVHYELSSGGSVLSLVLDKAWLHDPGRVFPVKIDPDVYFGGYQDCSIASQAYANTSLCNERLHVGTNTETPKSVSRALEQFDISSIPKGSAILSSSLALWFEATTSSSPIEIEAYALNKEHPFTQNVTWNTYDGTHAWTAPGGDHLKTEAGSTLVKPEWTGGWTSYGFTPQVEQWVRDPTSNDGILLKAHDETATGYDTFVQTGSGISSHEPNLNVVYEPQLGDPANESVYQMGIGNGGTLGVNVANGNLHLTDPDVNYSTAGYATTLARSYNSYDDEYTTSSFGDGWRLNMGEDELLYPAWWDGSNVLHQSDGSYTRFDRAPWADGHPAAGDKAYTGEAYVGAGLTVHENGTRTATYPGGVEWQFDNSENGFPQKIVEPAGEGNTISLSYTSSHLTKVTDTHSHTLNLTRNPTTKYITKIKPTSGESWEYTYNSSHLLTKYKGPEGQKAEYGYNGEGMVTSIIDPLGTLVISYGEYRVTSIRKLVNGTISTPGSEDEVTKFSYGAETTTTTRPDGSEITYHYDDFGNSLEDPASQEVASEFYAASSELEAATATADVNLQDHSAILDSQISQQLGANYVGEWFDPASGRIKIGLTEGYEKTVEQDLDNLGLADNTDIVPASASASQLETAKESLSELLAALISAGRVSVGIEYKTDSVTISEANNLNSSEAGEVTEALSKVSAPTRTIVIPATDVSGEIFACSGGACERPLRGGVYIDGGTNPYVLGGQCTAGFIVKSEPGGTPYVLTAGHCIKEEHGVGYGWQAGFPGSAGQNFIGKAYSYVDGSSASVPGGTTSKGDMGLIAIENSEHGGEWFGGLKPIIIQYGNTAFSLARKEEYEIRGSHYDPDSPSIEQYVLCADGVRVNEESVEQVVRCGKTEGLEDFSDKKVHETAHNQVKINMCAGSVTKGLEPGTSGGPLYKLNRAYGTVTGGEVGTNGCHDYFQGINRSEAALHVRVYSGS